MVWSVRRLHFRAYCKGCRASIRACLSLGYIRSMLSLRSLYNVHSLRALMQYRRRSLIFATAHHRQTSRPMPVESNPKLVILLMQSRHLLALAAVHTSPNKAAEQTMALHSRKHELPTFVLPCSPTPLGLEAREPVRKPL